MPKTTYFFVVLDIIGSVLTGLLNAKWVDRLLLIELRPPSLLSLLNDDDPFEELRLKLFYITAELAEMNDESFELAKSLSVADYYPTDGVLPIILCGVMPAMPGVPISCFFGCSDKLFIISMGECSAIYFSIDK